MQSNTAAQKEQELLLLIFQKLGSLRTGSQFHWESPKRIPVERYALKVKFLSVRNKTQVCQLITIFFFKIYYHFVLQGDLLYNEYIVYNVEQIRMRYVIHVNFNFKTRSQWLDVVLYVSFIIIQFVKPINIGDPCKVFLLRKRKVLQ